MLAISMLNACKALSPPKFLYPFASNCSLVSLATLSISSQNNFSSIRAFRICAFATNAVPAAGNGSEADTFLAEENVSWASLGVSDGFSGALSGVGLHRPSLVQVACIPTILAGTDVVVAAETGSGKTHSYLVPLIDKLCSTKDVLESAAGDRYLCRNQPVCLVLCPNVMLCDQVVRMANSLCNGSRASSLKAAAVCGNQGLPVKDPDIVVSTPVALLNFLYAVDPEKHRRTDYIRRIKYVVFDEADLLLCGSFQNNVVRLINMFRFDEKQFHRSKNTDIVVQGTDLLSLKSSDMAAVDGQEDFVVEEDEDEDEDSDDESVVENSENESNSKVKQDWRRVRKTYDRSKQYIFVAATLPLNGKKTAGGILKRMFPDASWISGNYLHRQCPRLERKWVEVTNDTQIDALTNAINYGFKRIGNSNPGVNRTLVFANTVDAVDSVANILEEAKVKCLRYHSSLSLEERKENLIHFQQKGGIFVCTDAAARGLDVPNITHVIQAEFASSAVDFLHRIGRTARAGQYGLVTSLFRKSNRDLVAAVRHAEELDLSVEKAFSRKRSFRNKLKKQGIGELDGTPAIRQRVST